MHMLALTLTLTLVCVPAATILGQTVRTPPALPLVQNEAALWTEATRWTLSAAPLVRIGSVNGPPETTLSYVGAGVLTPSGRIVVIDEPEQSIRVFDQTGKFITRMGRLGEGPGEFPQAHLSLKPVSEDTVAVVAGLRHPVTLFALSTRNAVIIRDNSSAIDRIVGSGMYTSISGVGGSTVRITSYPDTDDSNAPDGKVRSPKIKTYWATADLSWLLSLGEFAGAENVKVPANPPSTSARVSPLYGSVFGTPASPNFFSTADPYGRRFCIGATTAPRVRCYDRNGGGVEIAWKQNAERLTAAEVDRWRDNAILGLTRDTIVKPKPEALQMLRALRFDRDKPYFATLYIDTDLNLWVENPFKGTVANGTRVFGVFNASGKYLGDVSVPRTLRILQISTDRLLATMSGPDDVPIVVVHELRKK